MSLRLAYLVSQYPATSHTFILREIRALRAQGFDIQVVSVKPPDRPQEQLTPEEREEYSRTQVIKSGWAQLCAIQPIVFLSRPSRYLQGLATAVNLAGWDLRRLAAHLAYFAEAVVAGRWITQSGISHIHSHFASTVALLAAHVYPLRLSLTIHGSDEFIDPDGFGMAKKVAASSLVFAISQFGRSQIMRFSDPPDWDKIVVVPLGVDPAVYSPRPFRPQPEAFEILSVGRLAPVKGLPILLAAVQMLIGDGRKLRLRLVGDGPSRSALEAEIARRELTSHVRLAGSLAAPAVLALYRETDIFVQSSFAEGVPVVLMEAMAMEIPCVATRITGIPELIRDGVDGLLVTPSSSEELAQAIARLMDDPELRRRMGESARHQVVEHYNLSHNTAKLAEILQAVASPNVSAPTKSETPR